MTREKAKKRILGVLLNMLENDDEALFGDITADSDPQAYRAFDAARDELREEFNRRGAG